MMNDQETDFLEDTEIEIKPTKKNQVSKNYNI